MENDKETIAKMAEDHAEWFASQIKWAYKQAFIHAAGHGIEMEKQRKKK